MNVLATRQDFEASPDIVTDTHKLLFYDIYYVLDPGSTLSYVTLYVAIHFDFDPECISNCFSISTPYVDSIMARMVYTGCVMSIYSRDTLVGSN